MRLLVADQGTGPDDWAWSIPGELVMAPPPCSAAYEGLDCACGCRQTWVGFTSHRGTTLAAVAELNLDRAALTQLVAASITDAGFDLDDGQAEAIAAELEHLAEQLPVGALVRRDHDEILPA